MFSSNHNDCIASTHNFRIVFILFLWSLFPKMHWTSLKGNALKVMTDISSSLKLSSMLCCQALLRFWLKLVDLEENLNTSVPNYCFYAVNLTC